MERIKLSKSEKQVLRMVASGLHQCPDEYPSHTFSAAVRVLKGKELVTAHFREGGGVLDVRTTDYGKQYMAEYPHLRNPINWSVVAAISSIATAIATTLALFVGCSYIQ
ncbi:MAG: hypothetical protein IKL43_09090 [Alistipes sp.]|mgnify:FL=1|nr:hypothetical protein [Alistipes sp.]